MKNLLCIKLKKVRLEKKISQKKLAQLVKCSVYKIRRWENFLSSPQWYELASLGIHLNVRVDYLIGVGRTKNIKPVKYHTDDMFDTTNRYIILE